MIKLAILTWLHNGNYGSILQAYALQRFLRNKQYEVQNIDLNPTIFEKIKNLFQQHNSFSLFAEKKAAFEARKACKDSEALKCKSKKFHKFTQRHFNLTKTYSKYSSLKCLDGMYDAYICGSDQIWSPVLLCPSYYFSFLSNNCKMIAYACSFGVSKIPSKKLKKIAGYMHRFSFISVRETKGREIVKELLNKDVMVNVDPTFLLSKEEWDKIASPQKIDDSYMLCYFLSYSKEQWIKTKEIAEKRNLKLVIIPTTKESYQCGEVVLNDVGPEDWVSLIKYATVIATDSFHGCVFSIIYNKQFMVFKRFSDNNITSQNSRVYTLLNTYGLMQCLVNDIHSFSLPYINNDEYTIIKSKVNKTAKQSENWLITALQK